MQNFKILSSLEEETLLESPDCPLRSLKKSLGDSSCVSRASSMESCMTFLIPDWSLDDFENQELHISTLRKLCAKFQVSMCTKRGGSSCVSLASSMESRMTFLIPEGCLDDFERQE